MKPAVSASFPLLFLVVSLALCDANPTKPATTAKPAPAAQPVVVDIPKACSIAKDKAFCVETLQSNPKSRGLALKDLSFLAMNMAQANGTATLGFISQTLGDENEVVPALDESLGDCEDLYEDAVAMLENAMSAFFSKGKEEVTKWLSAAMVDALSCEDGLKTAGTKGAMGDRNQVFYKLVSSAWSVYDAAVADAKH